MYRNTEPAAVSSFSCNLGVTWNFMFAVNIKTFQIAIMGLSPDVLVCDSERFAERLGRVQPDRRVLLSSYGCLPRYRGRTHVQSAGNGREQSVITGVRADACGAGTERSVVKMSGWRV